MCMGEAIKAPNEVSRGRTFYYTTVSGSQIAILATEAVNLNFNLSFACICKERLTI